MLSTTSDTKNSRHDAQDYHPQILTRRYYTMCRIWIWIWIWIVQDPTQETCSQILICRYDTTCRIWIRIVQDLTQENTFPDPNPPLWYDAQDLAPGRTRSNARKLCSQILTRRYDTICRIWIWIVQYPTQEIYYRKSRLYIYTRV